RGGSGTGGRFARGQPAAAPADGERDAARGRGLAGRRRRPPAPADLTAGGPAGPVRPRTSARAVSVHERAKSRVAANAVPFRLDARAGQREAPPHPRGLLERGDGLGLLAAQRLDPGRGIARERVVGAEPDPLLECVEGRGQRRAGARLLAERYVRGPRPHAELDERAVAQRVLDAVDERPLALEEGDGLLVTA